MKEKIKNQRSAGKVIPLHSKFTELANDVSRDTGVLYGQKEVHRANWCDLSKPFDKSHYLKNSIIKSMKFLIC